MIKKSKKKLGKPKSPEEYIRENIKNKTLAEMLRRTILRNMENNNE